MSADASDVLLDARGLGRRYGASGGVRDVTFTLRRGDVLGLLGLNGAGKSTTLKLLAGVLAPDAGTLHVGGHSMEDAPLEARARLGYLPDLPPLHDDLRVRDYLVHAGRLRRLRGDALAAAVARVSERCDLGGVAERRIEGLSKGYRQRVGLAQAMVHEPDVLLLDEPGSGLDPHQTEMLRALVREHASDSCVVFSTHLLHEARSVCNRVAVVHAGRLVAERPADGAGLDALFARLARGEPAGDEPPDHEPVDDEFVDREPASDEPAGDERADDERADGDAADDESPRTTGPAG